MKKSLLFSISVAVGFFASASVISPYLTPGAEQEMVALKSMMSRSRVAGDMKIRPTAARKAVKACDVPLYMKVAGTALDSKPLTEMKDTVLVTSYDYIYLGDNVRNEATIEYDSHGLRKFLKEGDMTTRYTYTLDSSCRWLSRLVETKRDSKTNWSFMSREERTIENDLVTSVTIYRRADAYDDNNGEEYYTGIKSRYYELEYRSGQSSQIGYNNVADAAIVKNVEYNADGSVARELRRTWYEPAAEYIDIYDVDGYNKDEAVIDGDKVSFCSYRLTDGGVYVKVRDQIQYYGRIRGSVTTYYDENGNVTETSGDGRESWCEASGDSISIYYAYADGQFVPESKYIYSAGYFEPADYTRDFSRSRQLFNYANGEWVAGQSYSYSHHLLANGLSEITESVNGYERNVTAKMEYSVDEYGEGQWTSLSAKANADGSYITTEEVPDGHGSDYIYRYYSSTGELMKIVKQTYNADVNNETIFLVMMPGATDWSVLDEYTTTEEGGGIQIRSVFKTNPDGTPHSVTEYATSSKYNGGKEFKSLETVYTYSGNGDYSAKTYETYSPSDVTKMALSESVEMVTLADGTKQFTELEYDDNGKEKIVSGRRTETKAGLERNYTYKTKTGEWEFSGAYCGAESYTTEDGVDVNVEYRLSDDQMSAIPERKSEHKEVRNADGNYTYVMSAYYSWDENAGKWIGESKDEENTCYYTFEAFEAREFNPLDAYNDEYMLLVKEEHDYSYGWNHSESSRVSYEWDYDTDTWKQADGDIRTFNADVNGNRLTTTEVKKSTNWGEVKTETKIETTERDDAMRVVMEESKFVEEILRQGEQPEVYKRHSAEYYTYDDRTGLLAESKSVYFGDNGEIESQTIYRYTYTDFTIEISGMDAIAADVENTLFIEGRVVSAPGKSIYVYGISGCLLASATDVVELPEASGIYIVKAGDMTCKVMVK